MNLNRACIFVLFILQAAGVASATTWTVSPTGGCSDTSCNPCCTIQAAVEKSIGGDLVSIDPGTYAEEVDLRQMLSVGDITLESSGGPGTVLVSPPVGRGLTTSGFDTNTVTVEGIDFTTTDSSCIFLAHAGDVVLRDVTANNCGYSAFNIDTSGHATLERCTANGSARTGIQVDGAAGAILIDCTANTNVENGIFVLNVVGSVEITNPAATGNTIEGISVYTVGAATITGATITGNGRVGLSVATSDSLTVVDSTITGNADNGIYAELIGPDPVTAVTLTNTNVDNNGHSAGEIGVKVRDIEGNVVVTNCGFDNNADDGFAAEDSVIGDLVISGGHADGNGDDGYDLDAVGNATVIGVAAGSNANHGFELTMPGTVFFQDCVANGNLDGDGFRLEWQDPDPIDAISVVDCTANGNGVSGGGEGVDIRNVAGPVTVVGTDATGNADAGIAVRGVNNTVLIRNVTSVSNGEDGIKLDAGGGPISVLDSLVDGSAGAGIAFAYGGVDIENLQIRRNTITGNGTNGVEFYDVGGPGPFIAKCNDIVGNPTGLYLSDSVTVDARHVWWGDPTGPSGQGPGAGDAVFAEPGGTILFNPWLAESFTAPISGCPLFEADFESGLLAEWDEVAP